MNNIINIIKTIWSNRRYRSLIILAIYIIFFTVVIVMAKMAGPREEKVVKNPLDKFNSQSSYEFEIDIDSNIIKGEKNDSITFIYNDIEYTYKDSILEPNDFEYSEILEYLDNKYIYNLLKNRDIYSKTEYSNNKTSLNYIIDNVEISLYQDDVIYEIDIKIDKNIYKITYN